MKLMSVVLFAFVALQATGAHNARLTVDNKEIYFKGQKVFLSGANMAWVNYARDFGSDAYRNVREEYQHAIRVVSSAGGNVIRVWLHIDGQHSPKFNSTGHVTGEDTESLIKELESLLRYAGRKNVFVILCLWNLAVLPEKMIHLYHQEEQLQSYLDNVLKPIAFALKDNRALGAYDIVNEPIGGLAQNISDENPCFDTTNLINSGANWSNSNLTAKDVFKFINRHIAAIKSVDPESLVTVGDSEVTTTTTEAHYRDYYRDECLIAAGGEKSGVIDFYQIHTYAVGNDSFTRGSPFKQVFANYNMTKPLIVGEFSTTCSESKNASTNYEYLYHSGYSGALTWQLNGQGDCADNRENTIKGLLALSDFTEVDM